MQLSAKYASHWTLFSNSVKHKAFRWELYVIELYIILQL